MKLYGIILACTWIITCYSSNNERAFLKPLYGESPTPGNDLTDQPVATINKDKAGLKRLSTEQVPRHMEENKEQEKERWPLNKSTLPFVCNAIQTKKEVLAHLKKKKFPKKEELLQLCKLACQVKRLPEELQAKIFEYAQELTTKRSFSTYLPQEEEQEFIEYYLPLHCDIFARDHIQYASIDYKGVNFSRNYMSITYPIANEIEPAFAQKLKACESTAVCQEGLLMSDGMFQDGSGLGVYHLIQEDAQQLKKHIVVLWDHHLNGPAVNDRGRQIKIAFDYDERSPRVQLACDIQGTRIIVVAVNKSLFLFTLSPLNQFRRLFFTKFRSYINNFSLFDDGSGLKMALAFNRDACVFDFSRNICVSDHQGKQLNFSHKSTCINQIMTYNDEGMPKAAITTGDGSLHLWNLLTGVVESVFATIAHPNCCMTIFKDQNQNKLAITDSDKLSIIDLASKKFCLDALKYNDNLGRIYFLNSFQEGNNRKFIVGAEDNALLIDYSAGIFEQAFKSSPTSATCTIL